jgi:hypothetical protein
MREAHLRILRQLKVPNIQEILPNPHGVNESNPALENVSMVMGRMAAAFPDQDHLAHIRTHLIFAVDPNYGSSPVVGPMFTQQLLQHIQQHITLHYLQSMRNEVAVVSGGNDILKLNEERPLDKESQQALALAAQFVSQQSQQEFASFMPVIAQLAQKAAQAQQQQIEAQALADPTAQVLMKTQMAETQRKSQESQAKMQLDNQGQQQEFQIKLAELQQKVQELQTKYATEKQIDSQRHATDIAMANINNAAKERVAMITANAQMSQQQVALDAEQNMSAMEAINASNQDIRQHGLEVQKQAFEQQAAQVQHQVELEQAQQAHQQEIEQSAQQHAMGMQQSDQQHQQQMAQAQEQQALQPQPPTQGQ